MWMTLPPWCPSPKGPCTRSRRRLKVCCATIRWSFPAWGSWVQKLQKKKVLNWVYVWGVFWVYISSFPLIIYIAARVPEQSGDCTKSLEGMEMLCLKKT